jgi:hypothetical protein
MGQFRVEGVYELPELPDYHLIEVTVEEPPSRVDPGKFTQEGSSHAGWWEWYLDLENGQPLGQSPLDAYGPARTRLAFFLQSVDFSRPLLTAFGSVELPAPMTLPPRLRGLDYELRELP